MSGINNGVFLLLNIWKKRELVASQSVAFYFQRTKVCYPVLNWLVQFEVLIYHISDNKLLIYAISTNYTKLGHFHKFIHRKYLQIFIKHVINNVDDTLAYLLIPWSRVLVEKLIVFQLVKKLSAFYGTRMFIATFTSARHLSVSGARPIQSMPLMPLREYPYYCPI
jgi:hypothetical protein